MDKETVTREYNAVRSIEGQIIIERCQRFIEDIACSQIDANLVKGMVMLLRHIKDAEEDFNALREQQ